jgi:hypothetical protein
MENDWSNVGGCGIKHLVNRSKREECERQWYENSPKAVQARADETLSLAALEQARKDEEGWSPLAIGGVIAASLLSIAGMVVLIKKFGKRKK